MSVEVAVFSLVEEFVAITVAPGIRELPDFTTPEMKRTCPEGASCATAKKESSSTGATSPQTIPFIGPDLIARDMAMNIMIRHSDELAMVINVFNTANHGERVKTWSTDRKDS